VKGRAYYADRAVDSSRRVTAGSIRTPGPIVELVVTACR
jgi:hypothetical protein